MEGKPFHIELLRNEIQKRKTANPRYSMRAFSRYLGLGPSTMSRILSNHQDLSLSASKKIIKKLKLTADDRRLFISSVAEEKKQRTLLSLSGTVNSEDEQYLSSFEETLKSSRDMIFLLDRTGRCVHTNEGASRLFNLPLNQMIGKTLDQLGIDQDIAERINESSEIVWQSGVLAQIAHRYAYFENLIFEILMIPVTNDQEEVMAIACHWRDITETVMMEDYLGTLIEAGQILSHSLEYRVALKDVADLLNATVCEAVVIKLTSTNEMIEKGDRTLIENLHQFFPLNNRNTEFKNLMESKEACKLTHLDEVSLNISKSPAGKLGSLLCLPMCCRDQVFGAMVLLRSDEREPFTDLDQKMAEALSLRAADTIDYCLLVEKCN